MPSKPPSTRRGGTDNGAGELESSAVAPSPADLYASAIRGARDVDSDVPNALNSQLYSMFRVNQTSRRAFLKGLINLFDEMQASRN